MILLNNVTHHNNLRIYLTYNCYYLKRYYIFFPFVSAQNRSVRDFDLLVDYDNDSWPIIHTTIPRVGRHILKSRHVSHVKKIKKIVLNWGICTHNRQWPRGKKSRTSLKKILYRSGKKNKTWPKLKRVVRGRKRYCRDDNWLYNWVGSHIYAARTLVGSHFRNGLC